MIFLIVNQVQGRFGFLPLSSFLFLSILFLSILFLSILLHPKMQKTPNALLLSTAGTEDQRSEGFFLG